ncbi:hypothetical protein HK105_201634 [Polyrhizophydium stewartii]|uniref:Uncharacterized protein n=1 Tax=Polyrhizophydium stewartii TaxID=2732419 RepID=A0ABR4NGY9_9FUNG
MQHRVVAPQPGFVERTLSSASGLDIGCEMATEDAADSVHSLAARRKSSDHSHVYAYQHPAVGTASATARLGSTPSCMASAGTLDRSDPAAQSDEYVAQHYTDQQPPAHAHGVQADQLQRKRQRDEDSQLTLLSSGFLHARLHDASLDAIQRPEDGLMQRRSKALRVTTVLSSQFAQTLHVAETAASPKKFGLSDPLARSGIGDFSSDDPVQIGHFRSTHTLQSQPSATLLPSPAVCPNAADFMMHRQMQSAFGTFLSQSDALPSTCGSAQTGMQQQHAITIPGVETSSAVEAFVAQLAQIRGVSPHELWPIWLEKRREIESNIAMLWQSLPNDSYDDVKLIMQNVLNTARWLTNNDTDQLRHLVPSWHLAEHKLNNILRYIEIVEDIKQTIANPGFVPSGSLSHDCNALAAFIKAKRDVYGDTLRQEALPWRVLGFPVDELDPIFASFGSLAYRLVWYQMQRVRAEIGSLGDSTVKLLMHGRLARSTEAGISDSDDPMMQSRRRELAAQSLQVLDLLAQTVSLVGPSALLPQQLEKQAMEISIVTASLLTACVITLCQSPIGSRAVFGQSHGVGFARSARVNEPGSPTSSASFSSAVSSPSPSASLNAALGIGGHYGFSHMPLRKEALSAGSTHAAARPSTPRGIHDDEMQIADEDTACAETDTEVLARLLVEGGLALCDYASRPRVASLAATSGTQPGEQLMVGVAFRFVAAIYRLVEHELDDDACERMRLLARKIAPEGDTLDNP